MTENHQKPLVAAVIKLLQTEFIPVAIDQAYQRRQKDAEGRFYQKIANQSPRKIGQGTTQGHFVATSDGELLGFSLTGMCVIEKMALQKHLPVVLAAE